MFGAKPAKFTPGETLNSVNSDDLGTSLFKRSKKLCVLSSFMRGTGTFLREEEVEGEESLLP